MKRAFFGVMVLAGALLAACCQIPPPPETLLPPPAKPGSTLRKKPGNRPSPPKEPTLAEKINRLILPEEPDVSGKTLEEAIHMLRVRAYDADTVSSTHGWTRGVNLVLISGGEVTLPSVISLKLKDVPFAEALTYVTGLAGMKYRVDKHAVVITPEDSEPPAPPLTEADASTEREKRFLYGLSHRILPRVSWQNCTVEEAVEFLRVSHGCDPDPNMPTTPRNFVLHLRNNDQRPMVTLDLHDIPILEVLRYIAEMSGLKLSLRSSALVFSDHDLGPPPKAAAKPCPVQIRARRLLLPTVTFQGTTLTEAVEFLNVKTRMLDPGRQGISVVAHPGSSDDPSITFDLKEIHAADVLDHIALQSGRRLSVEGNTFVLTPLESAQP
ncbi:MAG TPA: hypothetical protein VGE39_07430 [Prosthecobacter sp.]